ncbi:MAG: sugar phosphate nucleotidyltransferase [Chthoniobacterales bacterium]
MPQISQAFVLGAGLGTRLRPLTEQLPKPLVPIFQKPLITFALDHLRSVGVERFAINTHRLAHLFEEKFAEGMYAGAPLTLLHEPELLDTGGGIKNAENWLRPEPFIVYSGDILTDLELEPLIAEHLVRQNDVTLALRDTGLASGIAFEDGRVIDIGGKRGHPGVHDFANVSIWNPEIFARIPVNTKISFIPILLEWIEQGGRIGGVLLNEQRWFNIGSHEDYLEVHRTIAEDRWRPDYVAAHDWPVLIAADAVVDPSARLLGFNSLGIGCRVGAEAILENTVVWPGAEIAARSSLRNCIVRAHQKVEGTFVDIDI